MAKRKREHSNREPSDIGVGTTLAHLRGEGHTDETTTHAATVDEGWTVVGLKRRRKERESSHDNSQHGSYSHRSHHRRRSASVEARRRPDDARDELEHPSHSPPERIRPHNPFAADGEADSRLSFPENPFSAHNAGFGRTAETKEERRKQRKLERHYPAIEHSHHARLQSHVKIADLQSLVLYILADGNAPQWVSVRSRASIQRVVMLMVPGLDLGMFDGSIVLDSTPPSEEIMQPQLDGASSPGDSAELKPLRISPDDFYPAALKSSRLPVALKPFADMFEHVWPIKAPGEHRANQYSRLHSPIHTMLTSQIPKTQEEKQLKKKGTQKGPVLQNSKHWQNKRTRITEFIVSLADQQENEYVSHPAWFTTAESKEAALQLRQATKRSIDDGWIDTQVTELEEGNVPEDEIEAGSVTAGRHVVSVDCEMCKAETDEFVLTRVSLIDWDGNTILDKLVKPEVSIKDYLTQYSGITAAMLEGVTTSLTDVQNELLGIITPRTILVGHSLNSDLNALKLTHPFLVDTGILYPHPRGPPYKQSLKWLAQKYLNRHVQTGTKGHDSVEDARACLDLVRQKCEKGAAWGTGDTNAESVFKRIGRSMRPKSNNEPRTGAVIDWGEPNRGHGNQAKVSLGCKSDDEVVDAINCVLKGSVTGRDGSTEKVDFIWARLRELELSRGWWEESKNADGDALRQSALQRIGQMGEDTDVDGEVTGARLVDAESRTVKHVAQIYESLPRCTALIVYSGTGDPREIRRLQAMQQQYRREYQTKKWDNLSVKWTDAEIQALSKACQVARNGVGFIGVK